MRIPIVIMKAAAEVYYEPTKKNIRKTASASGIVNMLRASDLSKQEADELRQHYGLKPKGGLKTRAFWRGTAHEALGAAAGSGVGGLAGSIGGPVGRAAGASLGGIAGGLYFGLGSGKKYSRQGLNDIRNR